jgi:hypothetical protein
MVYTGLHEAFGIDDICGSNEMDLLIHLGQDSSQNAVPGFSGEDFMELLIGQDGTLRHLREIVAILPPLALQLTDEVRIDFVSAKPFHHRQFQNQADIIQLVDFLEIQTSNAVSLPSLLSTRPRSTSIPRASRTRTSGDLELLTEIFFGEAVTRRVFPFQDTLAESCADIFRKVQSSYLI